ANEPPGEDPKRRDAALRPRLLREVIGQKPVVQRMEIMLNACRKLKEPLAHILFDGPPGLGKTTFATVLPNELGTTIQMTSGPALTKPGDMMPFLTNASEGSIIFVDEIHRMPRVVEEFIYPAMEDFRADIVLGEGLNARTLSLKLNRFTLIGATTRSGMLSSPMRDRFKMHEHLEFYSVPELSEIVRINAKKLQTPITDEAALELARRSRGTPRIANNRLWWTRHFATSEAGLPRGRRISCWARRRSRRRATASAGCSRGCEEGNGAGATRSPRSGGRGLRVAPARGYVCASAAS